MLLSGGSFSLLCIHDAAHGADRQVEEKKFLIPEQEPNRSEICGDWTVISTEDGRFGWTPNDPDERAVSPAP